jgi:DNA-3-methyladenine glycosylase
MVRAVSYANSRRLGRDFYARAATQLAPELLGCHLVLRRAGQQLAGRIVEVEAYLGVGQDPASHAHHGLTPRNREMFATPGRLYVYFAYGMHFCMNVVCESRGVAGAVLLRAVEPLAGESIMSDRRGRGGTDLTNGPAKLAQAFGVDLRCNGWDLVRGRLGIWPGPPPARIGRSARVGIRLGTELPYRWFDADSRFVSPLRLAPPAAGL